MKMPEKSQKSLKGKVIEFYPPKKRAILEKRINHKI